MNRLDHTWSFQNFGAKKIKEKKSLKEAHKVWTVQYQAGERVHLVGEQRIAWTQTYLQVIFKSEPEKLALCLIPFIINNNLKQWIKFWGGKEDKACPGLC